MSKTTHILAALALSALATTVTFAQGGGGGQRGGGGAGAPAGAGGGGQGGRGGAPAAPMPMSFFITSVGKGDGANYGGLAGADAYCQQMGAAAGRGGVTWHAYLSQQAKNGMPAINARDRIGNGPWYNQKGQMIARDLGTLHGDTIDILTGSRPDGTAYPDDMDHTCNNYTSNADTGSVQLGHSDKQGGNNSSWNSAHASAGCSQPKLVQTGGAGLLYCFAVN